MKKQGVLWWLTIEQYFTEKLTWISVYTEAKPMDLFAKEHWQYIPLQTKTWSAIDIPSLIPFHSWQPMGIFLRLKSTPRGYQQKFVCNPDQILIVCHFKYKPAMPPLETTELGLHYLNYSRMHCWQMFFLSGKLLLTWVM